MDVGYVLPKLDEIILKGRTIFGWYDYVDTRAWAALHLTPRPAQQTIDRVQELQELMRNATIPDWWKDAARERYAFYNNLHPNDPVNL